MTPDQATKLSKNNDPFERIKELAASYKKGDQLPINIVRKDGSSGEFFSIILDDTNIGRFNFLESNNGITQIEGINIHADFINKGVGKQVYIQINKYLNDLNGNVLGSAEKTSEEADNLWASLYKDGLVEAIGKTETGKILYKFKKNL